MYGLNWAKRPVIDQDQVIICEGQIDVLRCHAAGIKNVVAPLGTAFTPEHAKLLKRCTNHFTLCLDGDRAGQQAAERFRSVLMAKKENTYSLMQLDVTIDVVELPEGDDPDSIITKHGADIFKKLVADRITYLDFYIRHLGKKYDENSVNGKRTMVEAIAEFLAQVPNLTSRETLIAQASTELKIPSTILKSEIDAVLNKKQRSARPEFERANKVEKPKVPVKEFKPHLLVQDLLHLALADEKMIPLIQQKINPDWTKNLSGAEILWLIIDLFNHDEWTGVGGFLHHVDEGVQQYLAFQEMEKLEAFSSTEKEVVLNRLKHHIYQEFLQQELAILNQKIKKESLKPEYEKKLDELHKELVQVRKDKV
jgi:DNA primase